MVFKTEYRLIQVKSIAECSKGSILQYFRSSLSYQLSLRPLFCLFLCGRFTQVLLKKNASQTVYVLLKYAAVGDCHFRRGAAVRSNDYNAK